MSGRIKLYRPCNGSEGDWFRAQFCDECQRDRPEVEQYCEILGLTFLHDTDEPEYPKQWVVENDKPRCTAFWPNGVADDPVRIVNDDRTIDMFSADAGKGGA